ncbi:MAG: efflux RND transporter periplasmic adaptor subunit [Sedimentisphaeraceae bacterium JB056]
MKNRVKMTLIILSVAVVSILIGYRFGSSAESLQSDSHKDHSASEHSQQIWTCSMHPQIQLPEPGKCPICGMDLIVAKSSPNVSGVKTPTLTLGENAIALMEVETVPVVRQFVTAEIRMSGKIDYDETRVSYITAWIDGRLDRLFVDYTGVPVSRGDHMVYMYSPALLSAQEEYLQLLSAVEAGSNGAFQRINKESLKAARDKLLLLGLKEEQIDEIEAEGKVSDHVTIYSPSSGIVIDKNAVEGMYVKTGTRIYTVADMTKVWAKLDAYESDMEWLRYGQKVKFTTVSYPGQEFEGVVSFIDPILDERTRTVKLRLDVDNSDGRLKPGMFIKAVVESNIAAGGRVMDMNMAGKWICPMHPGVVKESLGDCDICGMPLVTTESLGYVSEETGSVDKPLVIPVSAALVTGKRAIVYIKVLEDDAGESVFEGREVELGPRAGDYYIVRSGLSEGELVVTKGNFKIDSSLQIKAAGGMMSPHGGADDVSSDMKHMHHDQMSENEIKPIEMPSVMKAKVDGHFRMRFKKLNDDYFKLQKALTLDDLESSIKAVELALADLEKINASLLAEEYRSHWGELSIPLKKTLGLAADAKNIKELREEFYKISQQFTALVRYFGPPVKEPIYRMHCPMAFDNKGADWLQKDKQVLNPYFGDKMLRCGSMEEQIEAKDIWQEEDK